MKAKLIVAVLLAVAAALVAITRLMPDTSSETPESSIQRGADPEEDADGASTMEELAGAASAGEETGGRAAAVGSGLANGADPAAGAAGRRPAAQGQLDVRIQWPTGAAPTDGVQVYAFVQRVSGSALIAKLTESPEADAFMAARASLFQALGGNEARGGKDILERAIATAPVSVGPDGSMATLDLPLERQRVMVYAVGAGFASELSVEALIADGEVTVPVVQLGRVVLDVSAADGGDAVGGAFVEIFEDQPVGMQRNTPGGNFRARALLDPSGHAEFEFVPADQKLKLRVLSEDQCAAEAAIAALGPGEERAVAVALTAGIRVTGRVVDPDGAGVEGAEVVAFLPGQAFGFDDTKLRETTTDGEGGYLIAGVPAGRLVLRAVKPGYLESARQLLTAGDNEVADDLVLEAGRSITGTVSTSEDVSVAGLTVKATFDLAHMSGVGALGATRGASAEAVTGPGGEFTIQGLGAGPFSVRVTAGEESPEGDGLSFTGRMDGVRPGDKDVNLVLRSSLHIGGVAMNDLGEPVPGEEIVASRVVSGALGDVRLDRLRAITEDDGSFRIDGVTEGQWALTLMSELHVTPEERTLDVTSSRPDVQLMVLRAARVEGVVLSPGGSPAADVTVSQSFDEPAWRVTLSRIATPENTRSHEDGTFTLLGLIPGEVSLRATSDHFAPGQTEVLTLQPGDQLKDVTLRMSQGGTIEGVVFDKEGKTAKGRMLTIQSMSMEMMRTSTTGSDGTFKEEGLIPGRYQIIAMDPETDLSADLEGAGMAAMFESMEMTMVTVAEAETQFVFLGAPPAAPVEVSGKVSLGGEPLADVMITWMPAAVGMYDNMKVGTTEEDGGYSLTLDDAGDYIINVTRLGNGGGAGHQQTVEFSVNVPLRSTELERDFAMPGGRIAGRVLLEDGSPANGERVTVTGVGAVRTDRLVGDGFAEIVTDVEGRFEAMGLRAGTYQVMAGGAAVMSQSTAEYGRQISDPIDLSKDEYREDVVLELAKPGVVRLKVLGADGTPAMGASIFLRDEQGRHTEMLSMLLTSSAGEATATGIAPGLYTACARSGGDASPESAPFTVTAGEETDVSLALGPASMLVITLKGKGDENLRAASVQVLDSDGFDVSRRLGISDVQNKFTEAAFAVNERRVGPLAPGRYTVLGTSPDGRKGKRRVSVTGGDEKQVKLLLR